MEEIPHGNKTRKCKNCDRKRNITRWPDLRSKGIYWSSNEGLHNGRSNNQTQKQELNISDPWDDRTTPQVGRLDSMNIEPQTEIMDLGIYNTFQWSVVATELTPEDSSTEIERKNNGWFNPSETRSMKPAKFLEFFNVDFKIPNFNPKTDHFHFPIDSMLKLITFKRLMKIRWDTVLSERLKNNVHGCRDSLGFGKRGPSQQSLNLFFNQYLGVVGHQELYDKVVKRLKNEMDIRCITFGERLGIDSTPLPVMKNDKTGEINGHYYESSGITRMVKIHILSCLDTGIPIAIAFSGANEYDGKYLIPLIEKAKLMGFNVKEIHADGSYDSYKNWTILNGKYDIDCYFSLSVNSKLHKDGSMPRITHRYQSYHNEEDWVLTDNEEQMIRYLTERGDYHYVGGYYRNKWWRIKRYHPEEYENIKGERNKVENFHSILKEQLLFEKNIDGKGWNKIKIYVLQFMITMATVALIRAENEVKDGFNKVSEGVFS